MKQARFLSISTLGLFRHTPTKKKVQTLPTSRHGCGICNVVLVSAPVHSSSCASSPCPTKLHVPNSWQSGGCSETKSTFSLHLVSPNCIILPPWNFSSFFFLSYEPIWVRLLKGMFPGCSLRHTDQNTTQPKTTF